jgi:hypothetical protein
MTHGARAEYGARDGVLTLRSEKDMDLTRAGV